MKNIKITRYVWGLFDYYTGERIGQEITDCHVVTAVWRRQLEQKYGRAVRIYREGKIKETYLISFENIQQYGFLKTKQFEEETA